MDDYVWYTRIAQANSDELKEMLLDGWEPYAAMNPCEIILRKLVTRGDFELLWLQDKEFKEDAAKRLKNPFDSYDPWGQPDYQDDIPF